MGTIRPRFNIKITEEDKTFSEKFELDKNVKSITGIVITSDREDLLFHRGTQKIVINGKELFSDDYESKLLMMSLNVPADSRYKSLKNVEPGNGLINFSYVDSRHPKAEFEPYRVSLYVECEVE